MSKVVQLRRHELEEGDVVRLNSGGPLMLVAISDAVIDNEVQCIWVVRRRLATEKFPAACLTLIQRGHVA